MAAFNPATSDHELDSQMRVLGVPMDQRKRIIAAARLGMPTPLKQLGLSYVSPTPESADAVAPATLASTTGAPAVPVSGPTGTSRASVDKLIRPRPNQSRARKTEADEPDLDGFLAGGRAATAAMAKAKAAERARQEQAAREQAEKERLRQAQLEREEADKQRRLLEQRQREEEEQRRQEIRQARKEEKLRRREEKKQQREQEHVCDNEEMDDDSEDEAADRRPKGLPSKGFFSQAYKGNQEQKRLWSQPIKGQVSNNYRGFTDADLDRRFGPAGQPAGKEGSKLMTEEEVLALLRRGKSK